MLHDLHSCLRMQIYYLAPSHTFRLDKRLASVATRMHHLATTKLQPKVHPRLATQLPHWVPTLLPQWLHCQQLADLPLLPTATLLRRHKFHLQLARGSQLSQAATDFQPRHQHLATCLQLSQAATHFQKFPACPWY